MLFVVIIALVIAYYKHNQLVMTEDTFKAVVEAHYQDKLRTKLWEDGTMEWWIMEGGQDGD